MYPHAAPIPPSQSAGPPHADAYVRRLRADESQTLNITMRMPFKSTREQVVFVPAAYVSSDLQALQEASENNDDGAKDAINGWRVGGVSAVEQGYHTADEYSDPNRTIEIERYDANAYVIVPSQGPVRGGVAVAHRAGVKQRQRAARIHCHTAAAARVADRIVEVPALVALPHGVTAIHRLHLDAVIAVGAHELEPRALRRQRIDL